GGITLYLIVLVLGYYFTCLGFRTKNSRYTSIGLAILITSTAIPGFILSMHIKIILENFVNLIDSFPLLNILFFSIILAILIPPFVKFSEGISESRTSDKVLGVCGAIIGAAGGYYILLLIAVTGSSGIASIIIGLLFAVILINAAKRCR
ncbi:MAG: hypothetical protein QXL61_06855, partial [Archaeoglobaceae archaeon]